MELKAVKIYQAVEFQRKLETFFVKKDAMPDLKISLYEQIGVLLQTAHDKIIVPWTNVAYVKTDLSEQDKKGREPKVGEGSSYRAK